MRRQAFGLVACLVVACRRAPAPEPPPPTPSTPPSSAGPSGSAAAAIDSVLSGVHARLSLAAPRWQLQPLAFGQHLLGVLGRERVHVYSLPDAALLVDAPLVAPRAIVAIAGGSLVASGRDGALRFDPGAKKAVRLPPIPSLPSTLLLPERRDFNFVWALETQSGSLLRQRLVLDPAGSFDRSITLEDYAGGALAVMRDGAMLYRAPGGVRRALPENRSRLFATSFDAWRLLPGRRVDQAWAIGPDGSVELWFLGDRLVVQKQFAAGAAPYDAAANSDYLALVVLDEPGNAPRRFRLLVFTNEGKRVLERELEPGAPEVGEDWAVRAGENRHVALSEDEPLLAVGGPGSLALFRLPSGELVPFR
jgi:hypothetical protein